MTVIIKRYILMQNEKWGVFFGKNGSLIVIKINDNGRKYMQHQKDN